MTRPCALARGCVAASADSSTARQKSLRKIVADVLTGKFLLTVVYISLNDSAIICQ